MRRTTLKSKLAWAFLAAVLVPLLLVGCGDSGQETPAGLSRAEVKEIVRAELAELPVPAEPEPGLSDADVEEAIRKAIADMPRQEAGLSRNEVQEIVRAAIPEPSPGLTSAELRRIIQAAIAAIPEPQPGLTTAEVERIVQAAITAIPEPQPGLTSAEAERIVQAAIAAIPEPQPGLTSADVERIARGVVAFIPPKATPIEYTKFFVDNAITRYDTWGLDATLAYYNLEGSVDGQWYVFIIDEDDIVIGHPDPLRLGLDLKGWVGTDANGYNFGPDMLSATEEGKWVSYVYRNPETEGIGSGFGDVELKNVWVVRHDGLLFASGWYVDADEFTKAFVSAAVSKFRAVGLEGTVAYFTGPESVYTGLAATIDYYNNAETVEGEWFAFIADESGKIADHYDKRLVGRDLEDLLGTEVFEATRSGNWVITESLRFWVVEHDGWLFASGWRRDESGG